MTGTEYRRRAETTVGAAVLAAAVEMHCRRDSNVRPTVAAQLSAAADGNHLHWTVVKCFETTACHCNCCTVASTAIGWGPAGAEIVAGRVERRAHD